MKKNIKSRNKPAPKKNSSIKKTNKRQGSGSNKNSERENRIKNFSSAVLIALQYGFKPLEKLPIKNEIESLSKSIDRDAHEIKESDIDVSTKEKLALLNLAEEKGVQGGEPLMVYREHKNRGNLIINMDIIGNNKGVSEAILLSTANAILKDAGIKNCVVNINCIGDKDSTNRFQREIQSYYKKHLNDLPSECRQLLKNNVGELLSCEHEKCKELALTAPRSMNYLSEPSRIHFQEVLEYLESTGVSYNLADMLLPSKNYCTHTVFNIEDTSKNKTIGYGMRFNSLSKKAGGKREIPAVSITLKIPEDSMKYPKNGFVITKPKFYFVHVGQEARFIGLNVIEALREAGVRIQHGIIKDKLSGQLFDVENNKVPYVIMMGQKECVEKTAIVRNTENRSQNVIKIETLSEYLKKLE